MFNIYSFFAWVNNLLNFFLSRIGLIVLILVSIVSAFILNQEEEFFTKIKSKTFEITKPVNELSANTIGLFVDYKNKIQEFFFVIEKNRELSKKAILADHYFKQLEIVNIENKKLSEILKYHEKTVDSLLLSARIIAKSSGGFYKNFIIDKGSEDGIKEGQVVINLEGMVGRIIEVFKSSSRIMAINDINSKIPVRGLSSGFRAVIKGNGSNVLEMLHIDEDAKLIDGETLVTAADGGYLINDIAVGVVDISKQGPIIIPFVHVSKLDYVSILKNNNHE